MTNQFDQIRIEDVDYGDNGYTTEASSVGLPPSYWPLHLEFEGKIYLRKHSIIHGGELQGMVYKPAEGAGSLLTIYND